jgi:hypothetical protein
MTDTVQQPAAPAVTGPSRWERMKAPTYLIGGLGLVTVALHLRDPHDGGSWGYCPSAAMGIWCPGCGGLRAVNDLTRGDVGAAASSNLLFIVALPVILIGLVVWTVGRWRGHSYSPPMSAIRSVAYVSLTLLAAFTVLRNLPMGSWLAP